MNIAHDNRDSFMNEQLFNIISIMEDYITINCQLYAEECRTIRYYHTIILFIDTGKHKQKIANG